MVRKPSSQLSRGIEHLDPQVLKYRGIWLTRGQVSRTINETKAEILQQLHVLEDCQGAGVSVVFRHLVIDHQDGAECAGTLPRQEQVTLVGRLLLQFGSPFQAKLGVVAQRLLVAHLGAIGGTTEMRHLAARLVKHLKASASGLEGKVELFVESRCIALVEAMRRFKQRAWHLQ